MNIAAVAAPTIAYGSLSFLFALAGGSLVVLMVGLLPGNFAQRVLTPLLTLATLATATALAIANWNDLELFALGGQLRIDNLALSFDVMFCLAAAVAVVLSWRSETVQTAGRSEFYGLLLATVTGMAVLASAENLIAVFVGLELFSIPLYVLCAADLRRDGSLEAGLKYLVIGSLGSATLLYGLALIYGAAGSTDFAAIAQQLSEPGFSNDALLLVGIGLTTAGLAFKASIAPFYQWTPDVYEGAPTPVTTFMAVATKAAAFAVILRLFGSALLPAREHWDSVLVALAVTTIVVGNLGAITQTSMKRLLAYSGVAQAGYLMVGVVVGTALGAQAIVFYLFVYLLMNVGAFAVVVARERAGVGDGLDGLAGLGREAPVLAWSMTICMIALAGLPITGGFVGKFLLIQSAVDGGYSWLGVAIVLGSALSLVYYLKVIAAVWMSPSEEEAGDSVDGRPSLPGAKGVPAISGADPQADARSHPELVAVAVLASFLVVAIGFAPDPLIDVARDAGAAFAALL